MKKPKNKVKRIVLGVGHPWYSREIKGSEGWSYDHVSLTPEPIVSSLVVSVWKTVPLNTGGTGNWNKVRLVLEILK